MKSLLTLREVSQQTGIGQRKLVRLIAAKKLPAIDTSAGPGRKTWMVRPSDLELYLKANENGPVKEPRAARRSREPKEVIQFYK